MRSRGMLSEKEALGYQKLSIGLELGLKITIFSFNNL